MIEEKVEDLNDEESPAFSLEAAATEYAYAFARRKIREQDLKDFQKQAARTVEEMLQEIYQMKQEEKRLQKRLVSAK